jgi:hypothetical protein
MLTRGAAVAQGTASDVEVESASAPGALPPPRADVLPQGWLRRPPGSAPSCRGHNSARVNLVLPRAPPIACSLGSPTETHEIQNSNRRRARRANPEPSRRARSRAWAPSLLPPLHTTRLPLKMGAVRVRQRARATRGRIRRLRRTVGGVCQTWWGWGWGGAARPRMKAI